MRWGWVAPLSGRYSTRATRYGNPFTWSSTRKRRSPWQTRWRVPSGAVTKRSTAAAVPIRCRSSKVGSSVSGSFCSRKPTLVSARTASWAPATVLSRLTATGITTPGNSTRLRTGRMISMSSGSPGARFASAGLRSVPAWVMGCSCGGVRGWTRPEVGAASPDSMAAGSVARRPGCRRRGSGRHSVVARRRNSGGTGKIGKNGFTNMAFF